jgi:hypothetical protein
LFRRVNDRDSTIVTRNLWIPADTNYFFKYQRADSSGAIVQIPQSSLPIYWDATSKLADSIRIVQMRIAGLYRDVRKAQDVTRTIYHNSRLLNAGMLKQSTCGSAPLGPNNVVATQVLVSGTVTKIHITWDKSLEETGGEADVAAYIIQRRPVASADWEIIGNLLARNYASYAFDDFSFTSGQWIYGVVAQDCSPSNSAVVAASTITNP